MGLLLRFRITSFTGIYQLTNVTQEDAGTYICQAFPSFDKTLDIMEKTATLTVMTGNISSFFFLSVLLFIFSYFFLFVLSIVFFLC